MSVSPPIAKAPLAYQPGDVIAGKYELGAPLGSGGMGAVFRARNTVIDMPVALKLIRADLDRDQFSGRLLQEARAAAKLAHPAIVRVFDVGQTAVGDPFIVMELLEGETLSELVEREGRLSCERAVQLLLPIADALSMAHAKGFVHRDVKPDNVFICRSTEGQVQPKLVDFGIVKQDDYSGEPQTQAGLVVGSPDYMSPEQARGQANIDSRSDLWSFCVVVYEAVTGHPPFEADNYNALMRLIVEAEPATLSDVGAADDALSAIIARGMRKAPAERWPSLGQLGKALATWLLDQGIGEDACGASLEARWLSRSTDPTGARLSSSLPPKFGPEPLSGVRDAQGFGTAPTVVSRSAATPHSLSRTKGRSLTPRRRVWVALTIGVVAACSGILAYVALRSKPASSEAFTAGAPNLGASPAPAMTREPTVPVAAPVPAAPSVAPVIAERAPTPEPLRSSSHKPRILVPPAPAAAPEPASREGASSGASDLLSPY
ncbi:MAG: serine/threonine protein kinase [Myxococcales bacterium]|nr:MAG: serine/threonine protein kinase [Myxococcales bacterium]